MKKNGGEGELKRELRLIDAVGIGLGAVIGAGIFVVSGVAAEIAGPAMLISLLIAGLAASLNGLSSAQLASLFPKAGGTYEYGYELLHPLAGFSAGWMFLISKLAGWMFLISKLAGGGVVALGFGSYLQLFFPGLDSRLSATIAVLIVLAANLLGIKKAGRLNRIIVTITVSALLYFVFAGFTVFDSSQFVSFMPHGVTSVLEASAVLFFAFTGYARIATLGEEVSEPQRTIPQAIIITLVSSIILYGLVSLVVLGAIGAKNMAIGGSPLFSAAEVMTWPAIRTIIILAAITAMLGVLLSQVLGTSRMFFAMGRRHDIPKLFSRVSEKKKVPVYGILLSAFTVLLTVWLGELKFITQTASFTILVYYSIANLSATRLSLTERFLPAWIPWSGFILCLLMAFNLPVQSILVGLTLLVLGHLFRLIFKITTE